MKLMGMKGWLHWSAWYFKFSMFMLTSVGLMTFLFHIKVGFRLQAKPKDNNSVSLYPLLNTLFCAFRQEQGLSVKAKTSNNTITADVCIDSKRKLTVSEIVTTCLWVLFEALYSPITMLIATRQEPSEIQKRRVKTCVKLKTAE